MTKRSKSETERILPSGQVADPGPAPESGRAIRPEPDIDDPPRTIDAGADVAAADRAAALMARVAESVDASTLTDAEIDARIAAGVVDADAEIAAADAAALALAPGEPHGETAGDPHVSLTPATHVRLYLKDLKAKNGALVRAATAIHHPHVGSFPRMLTVSLAPGVSTMFERAGQDADGFEVYRQPDF